MGLNWIRKQVLCTLGMMYVVAGFGQVDTVSIGLVQIEADRYEAWHADAEVDVINIEKTMVIPSSEGIDFLRRSLPVNLRGYGPGSSFGLSLRGSGTGQSQVLIQSVPFENPSLGSADISLLPIGTFDRAQLIQSGTSSYLGSGAIGGTLGFSAQADSTNSVEQTFSVGSFGKRGAHTKAVVGSSRFRSVSQFYYRESQNDFLRLPNTINAEEGPQPDAFFKTRGITQLFEFTPAEKSRLEFYGWYNDTYREIPPNLTQKSSNSYQEDENARLQLTFDQEIGLYNLEVISAWDYGELLYTSLPSVADTSSFQTWHNQVKIARGVENFQAFLQGVWRHSISEAEAYDEAETRDSPAILGGFNWDFSKRDQVTLNLRQELLNGTSLPLTYHVAYAHHFTNVSTGIGLGKTYRVPSLNDLYWNPGGDPNLKPESGFNQDFFFKHTFGKPVKIEWELNAYHRLVEDWIQWVPGPSYWSPQNYKEVRSYGAELSFAATHGKDVQFKHQISGAYNRTFQTDDDDQKQLIYTPEFIGVWQEGARYGIFSFDVIGRVESTRFTTIDHSRSLDPYFNLDVQASASKTISDFEFTLFGAINNALNADYQLRASYPMPGRWFQLGIKIKYQ